MITITCPWCEEHELLALEALTDQEPLFACPDCGTTVALVDEAPAVLERAA